MDSEATRRSFLKGSAVLAAPLVAAAPAAAFAAADRSERLARLEDEAAIRALHRHWLRHAGDAVPEPRFADIDGATPGASLRAIVPDHAEAAEAISFAADGRSAVLRHACTVDIDVALARDSTLAQMAFAQGGGFVRTTEPRLLHATYRKADGGWTVADMRLTVPDAADS